MHPHASLSLKKAVGRSFEHSQPNDRRAYDNHRNSSRHSADAHRQQTPGCAQAQSNIRFRNRRRRCEDDDFGSLDHVHRRPYAQDCDAAQRTEEASSGICVLALPLDRKLVELLRCMTPDQCQRDRLTRVLQDVQSVVRGLRLQCKVFGSLHTGLLIPTSDIDCLLVADNHLDDERSTTLPSAIQNILRSLPDLREMPSRRRQAVVAGGLRIVRNAFRGSCQFDQVTAITHAKVPIIKLVHRKERIPVDLAFEPDGCTSSQFLCTEFQRPGNELARALTVLVKALVSNRRFDDPSTGGLGSFPIAIMALFYLQTEVAQRFPSELRGSIGVVFTGFLTFFGHTFNHRQQGIDYVRRIVFPQTVSDRLYILNPINPALNCAKAASRYSGEVVPYFCEVSKALSSLLNMEVGETRLEEALRPFFVHAVRECDNWKRVKSAAARCPYAQQHVWDSQTNMYVGATMDLE